MAGSPQAIASEAKRFFNFVTQGAVTDYEQTHSTGSFRVFFKHLDKGAGQKGLVLDGLQSPYGAGNPLLPWGKWAASNGRWRIVCRRKKIGVYTIGN
jgi:hypothetical protein